MNRTIKQTLLPLAGALLLTLPFAACSNDDDDNLKIVYETSLTTTAAHIFDSFQPTMDEDFAMKGSAGDWTLNLHSFIYNAAGDLIDQQEDAFGNINATMTRQLDLNPGTYTVVSIADFEGNWNGDHFKFWNVSGTEKLSELTIRESETICTSAMETLGVDVRQIKVSDKAQAIDVDIKPVTGLIEVIIWDDDFSNAGQNGFSLFAPYIQDLTVFAPNVKQVVKFDGANGQPTFDYGVQAARFALAKHSPRNQAAANGHKQILSYRAFLPENDKRFYWELNTIPGGGQYLFNDGKDKQTSDMTDNSVDIQSGKQYVLDLVLDAFYLFLEEHDPSVDMFARLEKHMKSYNSKVITQPLLENRYDGLVGMSRSQLESRLNLQEFYSNGNAVSYMGTGLISYITVYYEDDTFAKSKRIVLTWGISTQSDAEIITECLNDLYTVWEKGTTATMKQYINGKTLDEATAAIIWDTTNFKLYFEGK